MKRIIMLLLSAFFAMASAFAQADKIVGVYYASHEGDNSRVKFYKVDDGYRAQVIWVENMKDKNGNIRCDKNNPDPSKRNTPSDKIVLINKIKYNAKDKVWDGGEIYDPTSGRSWTVTCSFEKDDVLKVRGSFGFIGKSVYWKKEK